IQVIPQPKLDHIVQAQWLTQIDISWWSEQHPILGEIRFAIGLHINADHTGAPSKHTGQRTDQQ
ncbi:MAG: hypothetical protein KDE45_16000, partial [Caldilineaceae bacterium]|nr:hypothetical protein [Caldilineaceae bacterium]